MSVPTERLSALVLAGGEARRLGGNKAQAEVAGRGLLDRCLDLVRAVSTDVVLLPGRRRIPQADAPDLRVVADWPGGHGPLAALGAGLEVSRAPFAVLLPCDMPYPSRELVTALVERAHHQDADVVALSGPGGLEPFLAIYRTALVGAVRAHLDAGGRSLRSLLDTVAVHAVDPVDLGVDDRCLRNVNTPADLADARAEGPP